MPMGTPVFIEGPYGRFTADAAIGHARAPRSARASASTPLREHPAGPRRARGRRRAAARPHPDDLVLRDEIADEVDRRERRGSGRRSARARQVRITASTLRRALPDIHRPRRLHLRPRGLHRLGRRGVPPAPACRRPASTSNPSSSERPSHATRTHRHHRDRPRHRRRAPLQAAARLEPRPARPPRAATAAARRPPRPPVDPSSSDSPSSRHPERHPVEQRLRVLGSAARRRRRPSPATSSRTGTATRRSR